MIAETKTLWGIPIVETDAMPKGEIIFGRFPTLEELIASGLSLEQWIQVHAKEFCKVTGLDKSE